MAATKDAPKTAATDDLLLILATEGAVPVRALLDRVPEEVVSLAWVRGLVELGRTKYVVTGNPATNVTVHNGVNLPPATVVIEDGVEWPLPNAPLDQLASLADVLAEKLPVCPRYQLYRLEVLVNKDPERWDWLKPGEAVAGRDTRYARQEIDRAAAENLYGLFVRLTRKGRAALAAS